MNSVIHNAEHEARGRLEPIGLEAEEKDCYVVVPVEEYDGSASKNEEEGVDELWDLGVYEQGDPDAATA